MISIYAISLIVLLAYVFVILRYCWAWVKIKEHRIAGESLDTSISIILPCRNESQSLSSCLTSISGQNFPSEMFEVIVIDDHSEDNTVEIGQGFFDANPDINGRVVQLTGVSASGKKDAITVGVNNARYPLIATIDADCRVPSSWLRSLVTFYQHTKAKMIAAPVDIMKPSNLTQQMQELEILGLQAVAAGGIQMQEPVLCNGANLCYEKTVFEEVGGYSGNTRVRSGDDLFLMQKIKKLYPEGLKYLKSNEAVVQTSATKTAVDFMEQRKRWVSKVIFVPDLTTIFIAFIVYFANLSLLINVVLWLLLPDFSGSFLIIIFGVKALIDFLFLHLATTYFKRGYLMRIFLLAEMLNIIYVSLIGVFGNIGKYDWKGRSSDRRSFVSNNS